MVLTSEVFTPAQLPTFTDVDRESISGELSKWARRGGYFISVLGTTKLGKTTLVRGFLNKQDPGVSWSTYLSGQSLQDGANDLWAQLARELQIPTSRESGLASSDRKSWGILSGLKATFFPGNGIEAEISASQELENSKHETLQFEVDAETAVKETLSALKGRGRKVFIAIDDFHFVHDDTKRKEIVLALRPLTDNGLTVILSTIPGGQNDVALDGTNLGGRRKRVELPTWNRDELAEIATKGFRELSVSAEDSVIYKLADESFGSPQIMQTLCLDFCEDVNQVINGDPSQPPRALREPLDWNAFFKNLEDDEAFQWLEKLTMGPNPRKPRNKNKHPGPPEQEVDGYQLIMLTLHEMGSPREVLLSEVKTTIANRLKLSTPELTNLNLELKVKNLSAIGSHETRDALRNASHTNSDGLGAAEIEEDQESLEQILAAEAIPQPVFEASIRPQTTVIRILDPLLSYMMKWHPEVIRATGR